MDQRFIGRSLIYPLPDQLRLPVRLLPILARLLFLEEPLLLEGSPYRRARFRDHDRSVLFLGHAPARLSTRFSNSRGDHAGKLPARGFSLSDQPAVLRGCALCGSMPAWPESGGTPRRSVGAHALRVSLSFLPPLHLFDSRLAAQSLLLKNSTLQALGSQPTDKF
jgi:hypothetical protein